MSASIPVLIVTKEAAEDLTNDQYRFVVLDTGKIRRPNAVDEKPFGILQNAPASGFAASVMILGISKVQAGGTIAGGAWLKLEYNDATDAGKALTATAGTYVNTQAITGGAEDELIEASVQLVPFLVAA